MKDRKDWYCEDTILNIQKLEEQISNYFSGTNVIPYYVVALHDDDIFEDINNVFYKDPLRIYKLSDLGKNEQPGYVIPNNIRSIAKVFFADIDDIINRDIEIIKIVIPMKGLKRRDVLFGNNENVNSIFNNNIKLSSIPHSFVIYVKQRVTILDVIFQILSITKLLPEIIVEQPEMIANNQDFRTT